MKGADRNDKISSQLKLSVGELGLFQGSSPKKKCVDAIRSGWTTDSLKVTNAHKTYIGLIDHFVQ